MADKKQMNYVSGKVLKANRLRNIFAVLGIVLTTVLFTCIFTITGSFITSMNESLFRQRGTAAHGEFKGLSEHEYNEIKGHPFIKNIGSSRIIARVENPEIHGRNAEVRCASDEWVASITYSMPTEGRLPENEDEIAMDTIMLERLGVPAKVGETVSVRYKLGSEDVNDSFELVGYWEGDHVLPASLVWVSEKYADSKLKNYVPEHENDMVGTWNAPVVFKSDSHFENKFQEVILDSGYKLEDIRYSINIVDSIKISDMDRSVLFVIVLLLLIVLFCGYLIISNIFSISIVNDIHSYALFKVIGMTKGQLRSLVRKEVMTLCLIGVPIGIAAGYAVGCLLTPYAFLILNVSVSKVSVNPLIFAVSAIFSVVTVFISTHKSVKLVQRVSPIVALRNTEENFDKKEKHHKSILRDGKIKLIKMAGANVFRYKKKSFSVIISLAMSMLLLNIAHSVSGNFDMDKYVKNFIGCDFIVADSNYFDTYKMYEEKGVLNPQIVDELKTTEGISQQGSIYFSELFYKDEALKEDLRKIQNNNETENYLRQIIESGLSEEAFRVHLYGVDQMFYDELTVCKGNFEPEKFGTGEYILVSSFNNSANTYTYEPGETVRMIDTSGNEKEYEVMAVVNLPYYLSVRHSHIISPDFFLPSQEYFKLTGNNCSMLLAMNADDDAETFVDEYLDQYCRKVAVVDYVSRNDYKEKFYDVKHMYIVVGLTLSLILGLIGILNYTDNMITSIIARRREFALLQSIGTTSKQLNQMIISEGILYIVFTFLMVLTLGSALGQMILSGLSSMMWYLSDTFYIRASILCAPLLLAVAMLVPYVSIRFIKKRSVIDRLGDFC